MASQCTKFEVSRFTRYEAVNGGAKCRKWGGLAVFGLLKVVGNATNCHNWNACRQLGPLLYTLRKRFTSSVLTI